MIGSFITRLGAGGIPFGAMTVLSAVVFRELKPGDGDNVAMRGEVVGGE